MRAFVRDVRKADQRAKLEASRELAVTIVISLATFLVGPLIFSILALPFPSAAAGLFKAFTGADIYIASVSLLSISIYSISKEYKLEGRDYLGFPHATTILLSAFAINLVALTVYTSRVFFEAVPNTFEWREPVAGALGWAVFIVASALAYAVLVFRNDMEGGGARRTHQEEDAFARTFAAANRGP